MEQLRLSKNFHGEWNSGLPVGVLTDLPDERPLYGTGGIRIIRRGLWRSSCGSAAVASALPKSGAHCDLEVVAIRQPRGGGTTAAS